MKWTFIARIVIKVHFNAKTNNNCHPFCFSRQYIVIPDGKNVHTAHNQVGCHQTKGRRVVVLKDRFIEKGL
jgi:hypothetical protein